MAKRKPEVDNSVLPLDPPQRKALADKMVDTAFRKPDLEPVIMQLAKSADMHEVVRELDRMRKYVKRLS